MSYFELLILSAVIVVPCLVIVVIFIRSSHWFGQQDHLHGTSSTYGGGSSEPLNRDLTHLNLPPQKAEQVSQHVTKIVDKEVHHRTEKIRLEMKNSYEKIIKSYDKIIEAKDKNLESAKKEYESIRQNYQVLGKEKKQTESVVRSIAKGLIVINDQGEVVFVNPVAENILGVKADQLIGKSINNANGEHVVSLVGEDGAEDPQHDSKNHGVKDILKESTAIIQGISGQTKGVVSILAGMTQQKKVDEYKTEFLANVTHELRSPLICILKSIATINEELKHASEEHKNYLRIALRNAERLEKLVNDILDTSKMEAGKMPLHYDIVSAKGLLHDVHSTFNIWARDKGIEILENGDDDLVFEGDPERLRQVVVNLAANALKFTPRGGKITFEAMLVPGKNGADASVEIGVRDTGPGLSDQDRKNLFQKFASGLHSAGDRGTGLGLTIAKEIVQLHHGRIWAENNQGKGAHFAFSIPKQRHTSAHLPEDKPAIQQAA